MKNFIYSGKSITFTATEPLISGQAYILGHAFGVVANTLKKDQSGELFIKGAFKLPKDRAKDISIAQRLYWDDSAKLVTILPEGAKESKLRVIGIAADSAGTDEAEVICILNGIDI